MKRFGFMVVAIALLCLGSAALFAGGAQEESADTGKTGVDMTFWIFLNPESTEDPRNVVLKNIVDDYNANNEYGNTVTVESIHWSKFEAQAIQAAAAKSGPDIINVYSDMVNQHIAGGTIQPITKYAEGFITEMGDYNYKASDLKIGGEIYTLPWESRTFVHWYRDDIFASAPATIDELISSRSGAVSGLGLNFAIGLSDGSNAASFMESFIPLIRAAGGDLYDSNGKAIFNSAAGVKAVNTIKQMVDDGVMNESVLSLVVDDIIDGFKAGTIYSMNAGTQRAASIKNSTLVDHIKSAPMPGYTAGNPAPALVAGQSLGIGKYAQNPDMAFDFIKYFYSEAAQVDWLKANVLPARSSVFNDASIQALPNYAELKEWNTYAKTGRVVFYPSDYTEMAVNLVKAVQKVVFKGDDTQASLDEVAAWYNKKNNK